MPKKLARPLKVADRKDPPFYRYGEGYWSIQYHKKDPDTGVPIRIHSQWYETKGEAESAFETKLEEARRKAKRSLLPDYSFDALRERYLSQRNVAGFQPSTIRCQDLFALKTFMDPWYLGKDVKDVFTGKEARAFVDRLMSSKNRKGEPRTQKDLNRGVRVYKGLLRLARKLELIDHDSYSLCDVTVEPIRRKDGFVRSGVKKTRSVSDADVEKLLAELPQETVDGAFLRFLLWTGFRIGEASALKLGDIDFDNGTVTKDKNWVIDINGRFFLRYGTKNGCEGEYVVSDRVISMLRAYVAANRVTPDQMLFPQMSDKSKAIDGSAFRIRLKKYCAALGIEYFWPHLMRHTFCTKLSRITTGTNEDRKAIETLAGHSYAVDQEVYNHVDGERLRQIVNKM